MKICVSHFGFRCLSSEYRSENRRAENQQTENLSKRLERATCCSGARRIADSILKWVLHIFSSGHAHNISYAFAIQHLGRRRRWKVGYRVEAGGNLWIISLYLEQISALLLCANYHNAMLNNDIWIYSKVHFMQI